MSEALQIRPARPVALAADSLAQQRQWLADQPRLAELASAIEAEAAALNQISNGQALWEIADGGFRVTCKLDTSTRRMLIAVHVGAESVTVLDDTSLEGFVYNSPPGARWPDFLLAQHTIAQTQRDVLAAQQQAAENAAQIKRQGMI